MESIHIKGNKINIPQETVVLETLPEDAVGDRKLLDTAQIVKKAAKLEQSESEKKKEQQQQRLSLISSSKTNAP